MLEQAGISFCSLPLGNKERSTMWTIKSHEQPSVAQSMEEKFPVYKAYTLRLTLEL